ncbi:polysulfide reductase NrfD [Lichenihabitans sp. Uapishka_5]|uniref:NrfD/PsrC family molybdoenzyme membrane anchor subunit n=1 Tax=Lichenihabitans sp. Uapishka_5 TaxID=3037302 RepID=UPI0029E80DDC|nr:NrfD/PsrC family molybdoenzyme membrane anchor subunit [Lichenihabitans sp. Uapishka_5]MDX7950217.1 polysulfide reductase NrfD [Lichenihabitans sp. Uapishka_5]
MNQIVSSSPSVPAAVSRFSDYDGSTYYDRPQLKPAPFENLVVGGYIFFAGLSGSSALLAAIATAVGGDDMAGIARRGRYLALAAPVLGSPLLIYDLHTPARFYNMLRVAKATSPMSIGTWILMGFSATAMPAAALQLASDAGVARPWVLRVAQALGLPAALLGAGLSTYTAALLSATSAPVWAAAPRALAVRFGSSSLASAASTLALGEPNPDARAKLAIIQAAALVTEAVADGVAQRAYRQSGIQQAFDSPVGKAERLLTTGLGVALPLGLLALALFAPRQRRALSAMAAVATIAGSAAMRVTMMGVGDVSAETPDISFRYSTPENLARLVT